MRFIKLTLLSRANGIKGHVGYNALTEKVLRVNADTITAVQGGDGEETYVYTTGGQSFYVKESVNDVMHLCPFNTH